MTLNSPLYQGMRNFASGRAVGELVGHVPSGGEHASVGQRQDTIVIYDVAEQFHGDVSQGWVITIAYRAAPARTTTLKGSPVYLSEAEARADIADLN